MDKAMDDIQNHGRYRKINSANNSGCNNCPEGGLPLKVVLFMNDNKLRYHAVKHPTKNDEKEKWQLLIDSCICIDEIIEKLNSLGCPGLTAGSDYFPCYESQDNCNKYSDCGEIVKGLQNEYLRIAERITEIGINIPRYVCFVDDKSNKKLLVVAEINHAGQNILAKADFFLQEGQVYNLATCLLPPKSLTQIQNDIRSLMRVINGSVIWCKPENWGILVNRLDLERFLRI